MKKALLFLTVFIFVITLFSCTHYDYTHSQPSYTESVFKTSTRISSTEEISSVCEDYTPSTDTVWIPKSGKKYHRFAHCSGMKNPSEVTLSQAQSRGYTACKKCY